MGANAQTAVPAFTAGQVLTAAQQTQINTGIPVFATTTTRDAAFGGTGEKTLAQGQYAYIEATSSLMVYSGTVWVTVGPQYAIFNETQASGTAGGTFTSGSYIKRTLNTTVVNNITGCSIASSVITLPAGSYQVMANCPAGSVNEHKIRIQNTTASTTIAIGGSQYAVATDNVWNNSQVQTYFTLSVSSTIELQHRCATTKNSNGLGIQTSFGDSEIFSQITIEKVA